MSASDDTNDSRPRVLAKVPAPRNIAPEDRLSLIALLRTMMVIRAFEKCLMSLPSPGFQLLSAGEEAVAVGVCAALAPDDPLLCSGRSIGPALARGLNPAAVMAEILGKADGPCRGRGGRSHIAQPAGGFFGAHGVVGGNLSVAAGVALAAHCSGPAVSLSACSATAPVGPAAPRNSQPRRALAIAARSRLQQQPVFRVHSCPPGPETEATFRPGAAVRRAGSDHRRHGRAPGPRRSARHGGPGAGGWRAFLSRNASRTVSRRIRRRPAKVDLRRKSACGSSAVPSACWPTGCNLLMGSTQAT